MHFVIRSTMLRGVLAVPELLDDANQWRALISAGAAAEQDIELERRATRYAQEERDPAIGARGQDRLTQGGSGEGRVKVDRMMRLAVRKAG